MPLFAGDTAIIIFVYKEIVWLVCPKLDILFFLSEKTGTMGQGSVKMSKYNLQHLLRILRNDLITGGKKNQSINVTLLE